MKRKLGNKLAWELPCLCLLVVLLSNCKRNEIDSEARSAQKIEASQSQTKMRTTSFGDTVCPVNPNATQAARNLLSYLYSLSEDSLMLAGQHNYIQKPKQYTDQATTNTGKTPALWGCDFSYGTGLSGTTGYRQKMINEAIAKWNAGSIVVLTYHQVRPDAPDVAGWNSVKSTMTSSDFDSLLTTGTALNNAWKGKMDTIAGYFQQLQTANVPVLFRPYHEMNGAAFWWGQKTRYPELFQMTYNYLTNTKGLNNIVWVWNSNRISTFTTSMIPYYPGNGYVDVLATDVYYSDFNATTYSEMLTLAGNKPIALGEIGPPPTSTVMAAQPRWIWAMEWAAPTEKTTWAAISTWYGLPRVLTKDEVSFPLPTSACTN